MARGDCHIVLTIGRALSLFAFALASAVMMPAVARGDDVSSFGQRLFDGLPKQLQATCHEPIQAKDWEPPSGKLPGPAAASQPTKAPTTVPAPWIDFEVAGFRVRVPRSVDELGIVAMSWDGPHQIVASSAGIDVAWEIPHAAPPNYRLEPKVIKGSPAPDLELPLCVINSMAPSDAPRPGRRVPARIGVTLPIPPDADSITYTRSGGPARAIPYNRLDVCLGGWRVSIELGKSELLGLDAQPERLDRAKLNVAVWRPVQPHEPWPRPVGFRFPMPKPSDVQGAAAKAGESEEHVRSETAALCDELDRLTDQKLFEQVLAASKRDLCGQTTLKGALRCAMLQAFAWQYVSEGVGATRLRVNEQLVYVFGPEDGSYWLAAYDPDEKLAWWGSVQRLDDQPIPASATSPFGAPPNDLLTALYAMLNTPGHRNANPFVKPPAATGPATQR